MFSLLDPEAFVPNDCRLKGSQTKICLLLVSSFFY
jgi:hypothetical protein